MLDLSDDEMDAVVELATPISRRHRAAFMAVAAELAAHPGDRRTLADVRRVAILLQREFLSGPRPSVDATELPRTD
jgi:hypothetical protein